MNTVMTLDPKRTFIAWLTAAALAGGCAPLPRDLPPRPEPDREPPTAPEPGTTMTSPAVLELSSSARQALDERRFAEATQLLERAIRIDPQNGALWHELARVHFEQGDYEQARQLATRSNALVNSGSALKTKNDKLIEAARQAESY